MLWAVVCEAEAEVTTGKKKTDVPDHWAIHRQNCQTETDVYCSNGFVPGTGIIELHYRALPFPVAVIWWSFTRNGTRIEILNCFTFERLRRCGLMKRLIGKLFEFYPNVRIIQTETGTESGLAFLKALGFKQSKADGCWELRRRK